MEGYLGEFETERGKEMTPAEWALHYIGSYGGFDGAHHKDWVLDQVARILHGTPVICKEARWDNGHTELRFTTGEPTAAYHQWVKDLRGEYDEEWEEYEYDYSVGIAP